MAQACHDAVVSVNQEASPPEPTRVLVVDDQELFRRGLTMLLRAEDGVNEEWHLQHQHDFDDRANRLQHSGDATDNELLERERAHDRRCHEERRGVSLNCKPRRNGGRDESQR